MPIAPHTLVGHYEIIATIGVGGMGEVYLARDRKLDRRVALKILPPSETTTEQQVRRFVQEAKAASALNHPNIAHIYEIGEDQGITFIAMEYVVGQSLQQALVDQSLNSAQVIRIGAQVADALDHAHAFGIIHRDIKSSNIMLTPRGQTKILDFGLAKVQSEDSDAVSLEIETKLKTAPHVVLGTLPYMSPEQARGEQVDHRSDIFSLGVVLYQLTTGHLPFQGKTPTETANRIATAAPEPLSRFNYDVPTELERIIRRCLEKEPQRRYQTAADLAADLENLRRDSQTDASQRTAGVSAARRSKKLVWIAAAVVVVLLGAGLYLKLASDKPISQATNVSSIAVLPFVNEGGNQNTEYLSDGITESIINSLSQIPNLRVMARTTMFRYKGKDVDPQTVGRELGVDAVVTGKALQQGETLIIQADLVNVFDGTQLWGDRFNRKLSDVLAIQNEIARQIADRLRVKLTGEQEQLITKQFTNNSVAYDLYLKGQFFLRKVTEPDLLKSIDYYEQAIAVDPNYALAHVGLASSYHALGGVLGFRSPLEAYPKLREHALKALELDKNLAEANYIVGNAKLYYEWNWLEAEQSLKKAVEINPNFPSAHSALGTYYQSLGLFDEAVAARKRTKALDPASPFAIADVGYPLYYSRRFDEALKYYREALELDPDFYWGHLWIGQALVQKGMHDQAIAEIKEAIRLSGGDVRSRATLGHAYAVAGRRGEAVQVLKELKTLSQERYVSPYFFALVYVGLSDNNEASAWLEKAYQERHPYLILMNVEPVFDGIRDDPRFVDLKRRVGIKN